MINGETFFERPGTEYFIQNWNKNLVVVISEDDLIFSLKKLRKVRTH